MKMLILGMIVFFNSLSILTAQDSTAITGDLIVIVTGLENDEGKAMIALSNSQEDYEKKGESYRGGMAPIKNKKAVWKFENILYGTYAIKVFHDEDDDDEMDTNFIGIPSEDYGFSNNADGSFGPASWEDAKFLFEAKLDTVVISVE